MSLDPRTPVLVGAGVAHQHVDDPDGGARSDRAHGARVRARRAAVVARGRAVDPRAARHVALPRSRASLATRFGADARTVIGEFGILQQTLVTRACTAVARGDLDVALVVGGEAKYRDLRAQIAGTRAFETEQVGVDTRRACSSPPPTSSRRSRSPPASPSRPRSTRSSRPRCVPHAARRWRTHAAGARRAVGRLQRDRRGQSRRVAPRRDRARVPVVSRRPRTRCTRRRTRGGTARSGTSTRLGVRVVLGRGGGAFGRRRENWVFPLAAVESNAMVPLSQRSELHRSPAVSVGRDQLTDDVRRRPPRRRSLDLYSCFPSAVQVQAEALGPRRPIDRSR